MKPDTTKPGLIRGRIIYSTRHAGALGIREAHDESNLNVGVAYTFWHRHDEDPKLIEQELEKLRRCYESFRDSGSYMIGYEYREYTK